MASIRLLQLNKTAVPLCAPSTSVPRTTSRTSRLLSSHASQSSSSTTSTSAPAYPYNDSDGKRQKATIEHIFKPDASGAPSTSGSGSSRAQAPWMVGWQMNERNIVWNDDLKYRMIKRATSDELGITEEEVEDRLQFLANLLPGMQQRIVKMSAKMVARFVDNSNNIALRLIRLRTVMPEADMTAMINLRLSLLLDDDMDDVERAVARLKELLPGINVDRFVEAFPTVLDIADFEVALQDAARLMPGSDLVGLLRSSPFTVLGLMKGKNLIPYDPPHPPQQEEQEQP